jgi:hypothetical protein
MADPTTPYRAILADLVDPDPCRLDHDGDCQTHAWFGDDECPHARAKRLLSSSDDDDRTEGP